MTLRYLLDTMIVTAPISKQPDPSIVARIKQHGEECAIAAPVWHELTYGCQRLPAGKRRKAIEQYLAGVVQASFPILPYDEAAATWHGQERARLDALGRPAPFVDGQIAAIAITNGLVLVTINARDFRRFKALDVQTWAGRAARG
jgi:tRNA(fMet)-specific endonuclease VapC